MSKVNADRVGAPDYSGAGVGRARVSSVASVMQRQELSASTNGQPIAVAATTTPGTLVHTASSDRLDRVFLFLTNTTASDIVATIELGAAGAGNEIDVTVPANDTTLALNGAVLGKAGSLTVAVYAPAGLNAFGSIERESA